MSVVQGDSEARNETYIDGTTSEHWSWQRCNALISGFLAFLSFAVSARCGINRNNVTRIDE
jgi:hypothetical protein